MSEEEVTDLRLAAGEVARGGKGGESAGTGFKDVEVEDG